MEKRLVEGLGFTKVEHEWLVAWDCRPRPDIKYDRELVKLRQRCKAELGELARAARDYRREVGAERPVAVAALAAAQKDGGSRYRGPAQDPWGHEYLVEQRANGTRWQARSLGQDGVKGTDDDLVVQEPRG